jgi:hypothetical protein
VKTVTDRLLAKVSISPDGCWIWTGAIDHNGYGRFRFRGKNEMAYRAAYTLLVGEFDPALSIDHLCREKLCVNPEHLEAVHIRTNILRGTSPVALNAAKTHCKNGHPFAGENLRIEHENGGIRRRCVACLRASNARQAPRQRRAAA